MEAIINRAPVSHQLDSAIAEWLHATRRLAHLGARAVWQALIASSRASLLLQNGGRPRRRL
jgi:hypothetical protein